MSAAPKKRRFGFGRKAVEQADIDPRHYDIITAPDHHRKGDDGFGIRPGDFPRPPHGDQA